jgi:hypothetical protein
MALRVLIVSPPIQKRACRVNSQTSIARGSLCAFEKAVHRRPAIPGKIGAIEGASSSRSRVRERPFGAAAPAQWAAPADEPA